MGAFDLPDMYALSPWSCGTQVLSIHIKQTFYAHVTTDVYYKLFEMEKFRGFHRLI